MNFIIESKPRNDEIADRWKNRKNFEPHRGILDVNYRGRCSLDFPRTTHSFQNKPYPVSQIVFVRTGEVMITLSLSIDMAVACGKVIRETPLHFALNNLISGEGKNLLKQFHRFSVISCLPLCSSFALFFYYFLSSFIYVRHFFRYAGAKSRANRYDRGLCRLKGRPISARLYHQVSSAYQYTTTNDFTFNQ